MLEGNFLTTVTVSRRVQAFRCFLFAYRAPLHQIAFCEGETKNPRRVARLQEERLGTKADE